MQARSTPRALRITIAAWITILFFTGAFQLYRGAIPDSIVFFAMAVALILSRIVPLRGFGSREWQPRRTAVGVLVAIAAAVLVLTPRHGITDGIVLVASGLLVLVVAWPDPPDPEKVESRWNDRVRRSAIAWSAIGIAFCGWELAMYFAGYGQSGRTQYPALSDLLDPVLDNPIGRGVFVLAWLTGGIALARRGRGRQS